MRRKPNPSQSNDCTLLTISRFPYAHFTTSPHISKAPKLSSCYIPSHFTYKLVTRSAGACIST